MTARLPRDLPAISSLRTALRPSPRRHYREAI